MVRPTLAAVADQLRALCATVRPFSLRELDFEVEAIDDGVVVTELRKPVLGQGPPERTPYVKVLAEDDGTWTLLVNEGTGGGWEPFLDLDSHQNFEVIVHELREDPSNYFWG